MEIQISLSTKIPDYSRRVARGARAAVEAGAMAHAEEAERMVAEQEGTGVKYSGSPKPSSSSGQAPVDQTGALVASIGVNHDPDVIGIAASVEAGEAAAFLELGTSRMAPRPFLGPSAEAGVEAVAKAIGENL